MRNWRGESASYGGHRGHERDLGDHEFAVEFITHYLL